MRPRGKSCQGRLRKGPGRLTQTCNQKLRRTGCRVQPIHALHQRKFKAKYRLPSAHHHSLLNGGEGGGPGRLLRTLGEDNREDKRARDFLKKGGAAHSGLRNTSDEASH